MNANHTPTRMERFLNRLLDHKTIVNCDRDPYLLRWYLFRTARVSCFIHKFIRSDEDRALHDHPWAFLVVPVWQGYVEHSDRRMDWNERMSWIIASMDKNGAFSPLPPEPLVATQRRVWPFWSARWRPATYRHRVELIKDQPSWSVFFHFKREREWGFHPAEGFTLWNKWWEDKCE